MATAGPLLPGHWSPDRRQAAPCRPPRLTHSPHATHPAFPGNPYDIGLLGNCVEAWRGPIPPRHGALGPAQRAELRAAMRAAEADSSEAGSVELPRVVPRDKQQLPISGAMMREREAAASTVAAGGAGGGAANDGRVPPAPDPRGHAAHAGQWLDAVLQPDAGHLGANSSLGNGDSVVTAGMSAAATAGGWSPGRVSPLSFQSAPYSERVDPGPYGDDGSSQPSSQGPSREGSRRRGDGAEAHATEAPAAVHAAAGNSTSEQPLQEQQHEQQAGAEPEESSSSGGKPGWPPRLAPLQQPSRAVLGAAGAGSQKAAASDDDLPLEALSLQSPRRNIFS